LTPRHSTVSKALAADAVGGFNRLLCRHALLWRPWASWTPRPSRQTATVASGRYLPPYASWHGPLLFVPAFAASRLVASADLPSFTLHRGRIFLATLYHFLVKQLTLLMPFEGTRRAFWSTVFGLRPLFAAACILRPRPKPASLSHQSREAFCAAIRFIDTTPLYGVKGACGKLRLVAATAFCAAMRFYGAPGPLGRHGACSRLRPWPAVATCRPTLHGTGHTFMCQGVRGLTAGGLSRPALIHSLHWDRISWPHYTTF